MEQISECLQCIELKKSLQVEKKKVSQKNRLITLLRELVRSYEAKDLNLTFTDLSRIYESSSSEVTILKQRLTLYLNENQELLQLKNEISSRNDLLEKKYRDVEDEISHLRFVNKQLGDYYREKEADHDQHKDRLKKLARKLLSYEPKNSEVRKILNLQNTPINLDPKPTKNSNRKKNEDNVKDMKKDNMGDDLVSITSKPSDVLNSEELDIAGNSECDNDTDLIETNNLCNEEDSYCPSPEPMLPDATKADKNPDELVATESFDKPNSDISCEIISNSMDGIITCEESNSSSNCVDTIDHCSFYKNISKESSLVMKVSEDKSQSSELLPSLFEEDSCNYEDTSEQIEVNANHKELNDFLEFEGSLPDLISPLKSDEQRVLSYLECHQTLQCDSAVQDNLNHDESNKEGGVANNNEKVSTDIKNECLSNNGDHVDKNKKSPRSSFQSKYQALNDSLLYTEKPLNGGHIPLNENYASNYQFQSSHCCGCCNNSFDARPPITLKLYNCSNVEISIPPVMEKENLPIITVRDKCDMDKCYVSSPNNGNKPADPSAIHCSFISDKKNGRFINDCNNQRNLIVPNGTRTRLARLNCGITENMKEPNNPHFQRSCDESNKPDYYFLDYLSQNKVGESNSPLKEQSFDESEDDTIKCNRLFPIKASKQFDLEHFCYSFGSLSLKYSWPEQTYKINTSDTIKSTNGYSSLLNISQPPVFHNSLKNSLSMNKNEWVFGRNFLNGNKNKTSVNPNGLLRRADEDNCTNKIKHCNIIQKSVLDLKTDYMNRKNVNDCVKIPVKESVQNPFLKMPRSNQSKAIDNCFKHPSSDVTSKGMLNRKESSFDNRPMFPQSRIKLSTVPCKNQNEDIKQNPFVHNSVESSTLLWNGINHNMATGTSKSESESNNPSRNKGCSKSIFDFDQGKEVSNDDLLVDSSTCNIKTNSVAAAHKEAKLNQMQKSSPSINFNSSTEVVAAVQSVSPRKQHLKENLIMEKSFLQIERSPKKIKRCELPQSKDNLVNHEHIFKKPGSVNSKATSKVNVNITENNSESSMFINKGTIDLNEKSTVDSPKKVDKCSKLIKKKSSPEIKTHCNKKIFPLQNGLCKEPKSSSGSIFKPGRKCAMVSHKKEIDISRDLVTDDEDEKSDNELTEIFKEMEHINIPLLSPLRKTPEIPATETPGIQESESNLEENLDSGKKYKETYEAKFSSEVEEETLNNSLKKTLVNKETLSKCDIIKSRFKDNENIIHVSKKSFSSIDESKNIFPSNDLEEETNIHKENSVNHENSKTESCTDTAVNPAHDEVLESTNIENFDKNKEIKNVCRKRKKSTDNSDYEAENYTSSTECKSNIAKETISSIDNDCPSKDVEPSACDDKDEFNESTAGDKKPTICLGFYVNRTDEETTSTVPVPSLSEIKTERLTVINNLNTDSCNPENDDMLHIEEVEQGEEISFKKEDTPGNKRKLDENDGHVEGICSKKPKMFSGDECIGCESDVFICALRYLSAAAVASSDGKVCSLPKTNSDVNNLPMKIAINHIKNLIIEAFQSIDSNVYNVLNCSVKKIHQIHDASPVSLAKAIIEIIVESNDNSEAKDKPYMPSMTKTVKMCLLTAISYLGYNRDFVMQFCEVFEQYISSFYDKTLRVGEGSQLVIFYTSFCRSYNLDDKVRYLIYDVLYTRNVKAYPMVYKAIQTWPDILPHADNCFAKDCLLTQTIIFILLSGTSSVDDKKGSVYSFNQLRCYLYKYFGYKCSVIRREELTDKIIENISAKGASVALVLLCKCEPWEWSLTVVEKKLLQILEPPRTIDDESVVCEYILTIARIVRGFPIAKAAHVVKYTLEVFERMLLESNSNHLSEIIIEAISLLRRHNLMKCTAILMNWKPITKQITEKTINHISTILRVKNIIYWKNVYSAHSSNIIHNTRRFKRNRKPGFLNPP